ncbi:hypothetical protein [Agromyces ramosus]|nr:hypothetical protein [Agromyces ramosus]
MRSWWGPRWLVDAPGLTAAAIGSVLAIVTAIARAWVVLVEVLR